MALPMTSGDIAVAVPPPTDATIDTRAWQKQAARFRERSVRQGAAQLATTLLPLAGLFVLMYFSLGYSYWLTLALAPIAAGFQIRTFIIMHDCSHGSFVPSKRANEILGFITGLITMFPFAQWRREHAIHHASSGDLDRRGHGDVATLTVSEYLALDKKGRLKYRIFRSPISLFVIGPLYLWWNNRVPSSGDDPNPPHAVGVHAANVLLVLIAVLIHFTIGLGAALAIYFPVYMLAGSAGIWLFYVQHQFEDTYWRDHEEWDYATSAMHGSSYYRLPRVLEWMTGSIGLHHVHHLDPRIPNYHLRRAHESAVEFSKVPTLTIRDSLRSVNLKLWDEEENRLVGFAAARRREKRSL
ncbi:MAG: fatty acid desaturase [Gemmatimonadaceae bacterium]